jgi:CheY-like chemotaxis protein
MKPLLILVIDDNRDSREMYELYLGMVGYKVETATNGREGVVKAVALAPDLIVMDLDMPEVDGWTAIRELRSDTNTVGIPIVVLTGHDFKDFLKPSALAVGARSFLTKPCLPERLAREISERLGAAGRSAPRARSVF